MGCRLDMSIPTTCPQDVSLFSIFIDMMVFSMTHPLPLYPSTPLPLYPSTPLPLYPSTLNIPLLSDA